MPHAVLIGASVGRDWDFPGLPRRRGLRDWRCGFEARFEFDKGPALERVLARSDDLPDFVVLKECAAYFPAAAGRDDFAMVSAWAERCRAAGATPVPATVIPIVRPRGVSGLRRRIHARLRRRVDPDARLRAILEYNDALRELCARRSWPVLDLERAVADSAGDRGLPSGLARPDGLHLNPAGYLRLDAVAASFLESLAEGRMRAGAAVGSEPGQRP